MEGKFRGEGLSFRCKSSAGILTQGWVDKCGRAPTYTEKSICYPGRIWNCHHRVSHGCCMLCIVWKASCLSPMPAEIIKEGSQNTGEHGSAGKEGSRAMGFSSEKSSRAPVLITFPSLRKYPRTSILQGEKTYFGFWFQCYPLWLVL